MFFKNNRGRKLMFSLLSCMSAEATLAASQPASSLTHLKETLSRLSPYVVTLSGGPVWTSGGETQTFYLQPMTQKTYAADNNSTVLADGELFLGVQRAINQHWQAGIGYEFAEWGSKPAGARIRSNHGAGVIVEPPVHQWTSIQLKLSLVRTLQ